MTISISCRGMVRSGARFETGACRQRQRSRSTCAPGVIAYQDLRGAPHQVSAFVTGSNGHLYLLSRRGSQWIWAHQGAPQGTTVTGAPAVLTYVDAADRRRVYAFVRGKNGHLYMNYWKGIGVELGRSGPTAGHHDGRRAWSDYLPGGDEPAAHLCLRARKNQHLYVNYWNGANWNWVDQGGTVSGSPGVITYRDGTQPQRMSVFVGSFPASSSESLGRIPVALVRPRQASLRLHGPL